MNSSIRFFKLIRNGEGDNYDYAQDHCFVKLASHHTNGELCLVEDKIKPGFHLENHYHKVMTEVFYMLEGELELIFENATVVLKPGDTITVPPNTWHEAKCEKGGKMLTIFKNGRFDVFLERLSQLSESDFSDSKLMEKVSEEFDIYTS